ncbi:hypothetical protein GJV76_11915 [Myroides sp. BIT-d1]|uniref:Aspartyl protease n=1 Tax=Myroides albus TaxID=2562892 RepID=A0A6I3LM93_9FLAO|nr:retropepsin-like aspartic protease [Myroides albus]MTG98827.1 hypothetical protein [Myroides albus]
MKKTILFLCLIICSTLNAQIHLNPDLHKLVVQHKYGELHLKNKTNQEKDKYFFDAVYYSSVNQPKTSQQYLEKLIEEDSLFLQKIEYWKLASENNIKLFNYNQAYLASKHILENFKDKLSPEELSDEQNNLNIWFTLKDVPNQEISSFKTVEIVTQKDLANLTTIEVTANNTQKDFVFDTGAGLNCITISLAKEMNFTILPDNNVTARSFTGVNNKVLLAIAPKLQIGSLTVTNAVFLVYPDEAFTFANGKYKIHGIIGFPIAKDLGTITFEKNQLTFAKNIQDNNSDKNLYFEYLRPILLLKYKGEQLPFNLDTGAQKSQFSKPLFDLFKEEISAKAKKITTTTSSAGAQEKTQNLYLLKNQKFWLTNKKIKLPEMLIDFNNIDVYGPYNYGNIGQDILSQYKKVIISFNHNYLKLE